MPYSLHHVDSARGTPSDAGSRPGPYEQPRRVLRGYDQPARERPADEREAPTRAAGREPRR